VSKYFSDPGVVLHDDGTATIPDLPGGTTGAWLVEHSGHGGFVLRNGGDQGYVTDEGDRYNQRRKVFDTRDDAIAYVIGDPQ
jgi:hypothetical protein